MVIAYKGFEPNMTCRGFQYELDHEYELRDRPVLCKQGFHACILPIDVVRYYPPGKDGVGSVYTKVLLNDCDVPTDMFTFSSDTKICGGWIRIGEQKVGVDDLIFETFDLIDKLSECLNFGFVPSTYYYNLHSKESISKLIHDDIRHGAIIVDNALTIGRTAFSLLADQYMKDGYKMPRHFIHYISQLYRKGA